MDRYDPEVAPDASEWLALDEDERKLLIADYHRDARIPLPRSRRELHAAMHMIVENQLAMNLEPVVRALSRLMKEGLDRHDAIHAIGSVVAEQVHDILKQSEAVGSVQDRYNAAVERLTAEEWRKNYGQQT